MAIVKKLLMVLGVLALVCVVVVGWLYHALTQPHIWTEDVGGGWKLEQRRYAMSHGTNFGVLFREVRGHRKDFDQFVYDARFYPQVGCVVYGTTKHDVQILAICGSRRATVIADAREGWDIGDEGVFRKGEPPITPAHIRQLTQTAQ